MVRDFFICQQLSRDCIQLLRVGVADQRGLYFSFKFAILEDTKGKQYHAMRDVKNLSK